jgi:hypothetical protein
MDILGVTSCSNNYGNTGQRYCTRDQFSYFKGLILSFEDQKFTEAERADLDTFMTALKATQIADVNGRTWLLPLISDLTNNTPEATKTESASGYILGRSEKPDLYMIEFMGIYLYLWKQLRKYEGYMNVYFITDTNLLLMKKNSAGDSFGMKSSIKFYKPKVGTVSEPKMSYTMEIQVLDVNWMDTVYALDLKEFDLFDELKGVDNLHLVVTTSALAAAIKVLSDRDMTTNVGELYDTELAALDLWVFTDKTTGAAITPSSIAWDSTTKSFDFVFTAGVTSGLVKLTTPSLLAAANIGSVNDGGFESDEVAIVVPAT